ncbi:MAG: hypothetical protein HOE76_00480 [Euryarchaeota archaeon]|jgi:hypothetical protein|nr:hypothetical protein [Euryarchaeota archaeon]MBT4982764.1 hypothetical protein [Euryarchaeota archaeon]MBT5184042.1 hypothetical protein [Euryarchaeota archaeon]
MILLATIISFTLISITEKISQHTENTAEDVRRDYANSVIITGAWVYDNQDDMLFMMEFGAAGEPVARLDVKYVLTCTEPDGTFHYRSAALGDSQGGSPIYVWELGTDGPDTPGFTSVDNFQPGGRYFFTLDGGTQTSPGGAAGECGPPHLDTHGIDANLYIHIPNGMSTHQILSLSNGREIGSQII